VQRPTRDLTSQDPVLCRQIGSFAVTAISPATRLLGVFANQEQVGAQAEPINTILERRTVALEQVLEQRLEAVQTFDIPLHLFDLAMSQLFPAGANRDVLAQTTEEEFDFPQGKTHVAGETDEQDTVNDFLGITALATGAVRNCKKAYPFIVANSRSVETGTAGQFSNFHPSPPGLRVKQEDLT
jgi:hypothetical protein